MAAASTCELLAQIGLDNIALEHVPAIRGKGWGKESLGAEASHEGRGETGVAQAEKKQLNLHPSLLSMHSPSSLL